jgi:hypothetical protein
MRSNLVLFCEIIAFGFAGALPADELSAPAAGPRHKTNATRRAEAANAPTTYCKEVAPVLQKHCLECHRKGEVAPFGLESYEQAKKRVSDIASVVGDRIMPPWKPAPHFGVKLRGEKSLTHAEIDTILKWVEAGAPEGNLADLPPPPKFPEGWPLGTPDLVLDTGADFAVPPSGEDVYRCFVMPTNLPDDVFVSGIAYRPGNRRVVHHILSYVDTTGAGRKKDAQDAEPGYPCFAGPGVDSVGDMGGWAPSARRRRLSPLSPDAAPTIHS